MTAGFASGCAVPRNPEIRGQAISNLEINEKKYPVDKAKGSARKYTNTPSWELPQWNNRDRGIPQS